MSRRNYRREEPRSLPQDPDPTAMTNASLDSLQKLFELQYGPQRMQQEMAMRDAQLAQTQNQTQLGQEELKLRQQNSAELGANRDRRSDLYELQTLLPFAGNPEVAAPLANIMKRLYGIDMGAPTGAAAPRGSMAPPGVTTPGYKPLLSQRIPEYLVPKLTAKDA